LTKQYNAFYDAAVTHLKPVTFRLEQVLLDALQEVKERDGLPVTEQVRRAVIAWLELRGVKVKTERKRAATRKRP
jgi:hypothetical protein